MLDIKIISEKNSRSYRPDFYLVLPWHFKDEILKIMGHHSKEIERLLGYITKSEVIHKDDMVEI